MGLFSWNTFSYFYFWILNLECWILNLESWISSQIVFNKLYQKRDSGTGVSKFLRTTFLTETFWWLLLREPNFVSAPRLCTIQNASNSLAKAHLGAPFLQNSSQCMLSNVSYFLKKVKTETIFHTSCDLQYTWNLVIASKLKYFSFMILKKLLESVFQFSQHKVRKTTSCLLFAFVFTFVFTFVEVIDNKRINQAWKQIQ